MTFPDRRLERPLEPPVAHNENTQDVIPRSERNQDLEHSTHGLVNETSRPLTEQERKAADRDAPVAERVYAPASERVPREPVPGHRDFVDHTDTHTPEREAVSDVQTSTEPSFTRVPRPSTTNGHSSGSWPAEEHWTSMSPAIGGSFVPMGIGWLTVGVCGGVGVWLWMRWRRERNKPINRLRRQALQTASQARAWAEALRERMPEIPDDARRPAMGLGTAVLSLSLLLWQQSQSRSRMEDARARAASGSGWASKASRAASQRAQHAIEEMDWQTRLMQLKNRWTGGSGS